MLIFGLTGLSCVLLETQVRPFGCSDLCFYPNIHTYDPPAALDLTISQSVSSSLSFYLSLSLSFIHRPFVSLEHTDALMLTELQTSVANLNQMGPIYIQISYFPSFIIIQTVNQRSLTVGSHWSPNALFTSCAAKTTSNTAVHHINSFKSSYSDVIRWWWG